MSRTNTEKQRKTQQRETRQSRTMRLLLVAVMFLWGCETSSHLELVLNQDQTYDLYYTRSMDELGATLWYLHENKDEAELERAEFQAFKERELAQALQEDDVLVARALQTYFQFGRSDLLQYMEDKYNGNLSDGSNDLSIKEAYSWAVEQASRGRENREDFKVEELEKLRIEAVQDEEYGFFGLEIKIEDIHLDVLDAFLGRNLRIERTVDELTEKPLKTFHLAEGGNAFGMRFDLGITNQYERNQAGTIWEEMTDLGDVDSEMLGHRNLNNVFYTHFLSVITNDLEVVDHSMSSTIEGLYTKGFDRDTEPVFITFVAEKQDRENSGSSNGGGVTLLVFLLLAGLIGGGGYLWLRKKKQNRSENNSNRPDNFGPGPWNGPTDPMPRGPAGTWGGPEPWSEQSGPEPWSGPNRPEQR